VRTRSASGLRRQSLSLAVSIFHRQSNTHSHYSNLYLILFIHTAALIIIALPVYPIQLNRCFYHCIYPSLIWQCSRSSLFSPPSIYSFLTFPLRLSLSFPPNIFQFFLLYIIIILITTIIYTYTISCCLLCIIWL